MYTCLYVVCICVYIRGSEVYGLRDVFEALGFRVSRLGWRALGFEACAFGLGGLEGLGLGFRLGAVLTPVPDSCK